MNKPEKSLSAVRNAYRLVHLYQSALLYILREIEGSKNLDVNFWSWAGAHGGAFPRKVGLTSDPLIYLPLIYADFAFASNDPSEPLKINDYALYIEHAADTTMINDNYEVIDLVDDPTKALPRNDGYSVLTVTIVVNKTRGDLSWNEIYNSYSEDGFTPFSGGECGSKDEYAEYGWRCIENGEYVYEKTHSKVKGHELIARMKKIYMENLVDRDSINRFVSDLVELKERTVLESKA